MAIMDWIRGARGVPPPESPPAAPEEHPKPARAPEPPAPPAARKPPPPGVMAKGARVRVVVPTIEGLIVERAIDPVTDEVRVLVEWTEAGSNVRRWFTTPELVEVTR